MKLHVITGLPRAGSTLFCNILNQNEKFWATSTSPMPRLLNSITKNWSDSVEIKNLLEKQKELTENKMKESLKSFIETWYKYENKEIVFDKSRGWSGNNLMLKHLYPDSKIIVLIRDLRNVFASIEKQHRKNPLLDEANNIQEKTVYTRADNMFSPNGLIGSCLVGIEDLIRRDPDGLIFVQYETLTQNPKLVMERIYTELEEEYFNHDFDNIKNTAIDCDGHYLHKYPHKGEGKIEVNDVEEWKKYISIDLANTIMNRFKDYNKFFGYK